MESTKPTSRMSLGCTWDKCEFSCWSSEELTNHLIEHSQAVLAQWTRPSGCKWQGCRSKAIFKRTLAYEQHLRNIHSHPLVCNTPGCIHKKPFRNREDLGRHNKTAHRKEKKWECPYDSCDAETRTFARKDKWLQHIRETRHEYDAFCAFFHCSLNQQKTLKPFADRKEISKHFSERHSEVGERRYECALGSCDGDRIHDFWTLGWLHLHLWHDHNLSLRQGEISELVKGDVVFGIQHVHLCEEKWPGRIQNGIHDCKVCAPPGQTILWSPSGQPLV